MADCSKCGGKGTVALEATISFVADDGTTITVPNPEADPILHPLLSKRHPTCSRCGGGGKEPSAEDLRHMQAAAKAQDS